MLMIVTILYGQEHNIHNISETTKQKNIKKKRKK